jgi:hypothetical protein
VSPAAAGGHLQAHALFQAIQHRLVARFQAELEHPAPGGRQLQTEIEVVERRRDAHKSVPGRARRLAAQGL